MKFSSTLRNYLIFPMLLMLLMCKASSSGSPSDLFGLLALSTNQSNGPSASSKPSQSPSIGVKINSSVLSSGNNVTIPSAIINTEGTPVTIEIFNAGSADLDIASVNLSNGDSGQFTLNTLTLNRKIKPSFSSSFTILLSPTTDGFKSTSLIIESNDSKLKNFILPVQGTAQLTPAPSILVELSESNISSGNTIDIGGLSVCSVGRDYTFKIKNYGTADLGLSGSPLIQISGTNANLFNVSQLPSTPITPNSSTEFKIHIIPSGSGSKNASFSIQNNDNFNSNFSFNLKISGTNPEINISTTQKNINSGDNYYLGYSRINSGNSYLSLKIENLGSGNLILNNSPAITITGDTTNFGVLQPSTSIIDSSAVSFSLIESFSSVGVKNSTISISNDDCDENPYSISFSAVGFSDPRVTSSSAWSARRNHVLLSFNNALWILGGTASGVTKDVYYSANGTSWSLKTNNAPWGKRTNFAGEVFNGKMWVFGGLEDIGSSVYQGRNDAWSSTDGITWTRETANAGWSERSYHSTAVFNNKIWVFGGLSNGSVLNDVWYSSDGINWTQATSNAGWGPRDAHQVLAYNNKLWLIGGWGGPAIGKFQDVWSSSDGVTWTRVTANANFSNSGLSAHNAVVFNNKMWVINGFNNTEVQNFVFQSSDGVQWEKITPNWSARDTSASAILNGKIWITGGFDLSGNRLNDIWTFWDQ